MSDMGKITKYICLNFLNRIKFITNKSVEHLKKIKIIEKNNNV